MRICISLLPRGPVPLHYNYFIQSAIYNRLPREISHFLHYKGIKEGPRKFKMFTFSRLIGDFVRNGEQLIYRNKCYLCISSPINLIIKEIYFSLLNDPDLKIKDTKLIVETVGIMENPDFGDKATIYTLSPITMYKRGINGARYYSPHELEWQVLIDLNARRKFHALRGRYLKHGLEIRPLRVSQTKVMYKNNLIKAWKGEFEMRGPKTLMKVIYDAGIGSKNSQGFGMIEISGRRIRDFLDIY